MFYIKNVFGVKNVQNMIVLSCGDDVTKQELDEN